MSKILRTEDAMIMMAATTNRAMCDDMTQSLAGRMKANRLLLVKMCVR